MTSAILATFIEGRWNFNWK